MKPSDKTVHLDRRTFMKTTAAATVAAAGVATSGAMAEDEALDYRNYQPEKMRYRKLGRTKLMCSTLTFGCGAALMGGKATRLLEQAFEQGINHYDVGTAVYYKGSEKELAPFLKAHQGDIWVTSKGFVRKGSGNGRDQYYSLEDAKADAAYWTELLEGSLRDLDQEHVDAYYLMAIGNPEAVKSEELYNAFVKARDAGKVSHFGISTHKNAEACLEAAIECGWYSLAMIAITPGGWYDWNSRALLEGTTPMDGCRPLLDRAREADIGLVGMKAGRFIAPGAAGGKGDETAFDKFYSEAFLATPLSPFQRSYAFVLENGLDTVNADMQNFKHFEENLVAARDAHLHYA